MAYQDMEESRMYQRAEGVADEVWKVVIGWDNFAKDTVGKQLVRAADSIGANIAESGGRYHPNDVIRFCYYSRGSLRETRYWLKRAIKRQLVSSEQFAKLFSELASLGQELNAYIKSQRNRNLKESSIDYITNAQDDETNEPTN